MFYRKNLPGWERAMRVIAGLVLIAWGWMAFPATTLGYVIMASGATAILTGFFGFLPDVRHGGTQAVIGLVVEAA